MWKETFSLTSSHWFLGAGPGSFELSFCAQAGQVPDTLQHVRIESPHNELLRLLAEYVLLGVLSVALLLKPHSRAFHPKSTRFTFAIRASLATLCLASSTAKPLSKCPRCC